MTANSWCKHETLGYSLKFKQVQKRISETCSLVWVKYGEIFRNATYAEAAAMRSEQANQQEGLVYYVEGTDKNGKPTLIAKPYLAEIHGLTFDHDGARQELQIATQANRFAAEAA